MGGSRDHGRPTGFLLNSNVLVYYKLPSPVAVGLGDRLVASIASKLLDNVERCGPLIAVEAQIDELKNALRDKMIEKGISQRAKVESASRMVRDFEEFLRSLSEAGLAVYVEEDSDLYRLAHSVYQRIHRECREAIGQRKGMQRDSLLIAVSGRSQAILVTRDHALHKAVKCLRSKGLREYASLLLRVEPERRAVRAEYCADAEPRCILELIKEAVESLGASLEVASCS